MLSVKYAVAILQLLAFAAAPAVAKPNIAALSRQCNSLHKQTACNELVKIALTDKDSTLRREAVVNLHDPSLVAKIVSESTDATVRGAGVSHVMDQSLLAKLATGDEDAHVRIAAVEKLSDASVLGKAASEDHSADVRRAAVMRLTDLPLLSKIAAGDSDTNVRNAAQAKVDAAAAELEKKHWDAAVDPFSVAKVEAFLGQYPRGVHATMARQIVDDERMIDQIRTSGPGSRFVLPSDSIPPFIASAINRNDDRGRTLVDATKSQAGFLVQTVFGKLMLGQINANGITNPNQITIGPPAMPCGDFSVFVISGNADNVQGDTSNPIRLLYSKQHGVVYLGGQGKVFSIRNGALGSLVFQPPSK